MYEPSKNLGAHLFKVALEPVFKPALEREASDSQPKTEVYEMGLGSSLFLIAVGAILRFAVTVSTHGLNLQTVGLILMIVGGVGLVVSLFWMVVWADRRHRTEVAPAATTRDYVPPRREYVER